MGRITLTLFAMVLMGCEVTELPTTDAKASSETAPTLAPVITAPPVCAFDTMIKNGSDALDPARSNYSCKYDGVTTRVIHAFFSNGVGRLQDPSNGPVEVTAWTLDASACTMTVKVAGVVRYVLSAPVLNADGTLKDAGTYNQPNNLNRLIEQCVHDVAPGQTF